MSFIDRHGLWSDEQRRSAVEVEKRVSADGLELVRLSFADLHGLLRGKALVPEALGGAMRDGCAITSTLLFKDSSHRTVVPVFAKDAGLAAEGFRGGGDLVLVPDPTTFRVLPWAARTGWMLCDVYLADGRPAPQSTRALLRRQLARLPRDRQLVTGLEVEFHVFRLTDPELSLEDGGQPGTPPTVELIHHGYQHLTEQRLDRIEPIVDILRRQVLALGLGLASVELEFGPSQVEFVFRAAPGMGSADDMVLFRSAVKQICRRHGYHATFMCRPAFPNAMSSGWHLHQSLADAEGRNLFAPAAGDADLSALGRHYLAGLLRGASEAVAFSTPTVNGYKRYRPMSLAPDRVAWGRDNRGAMLRVVTGANPAAARIENRIGEPAANPYLYLASQLATGCAGVEAGVEPPAAVDAPYESPAPLLPTSLRAALECLRQGNVLREAFGSAFIDYYLTVKMAEVARFEASVTDWETREYFDLF
jgi:glutamine synthetase